LPSLGIIFETVVFSASSLFNFSLISALLLLCFSVGGYLVFGAQTLTYSTFISSILSNFRLIVSDDNYAVIHKANPDISAVF
jgi:hypothetical protein